jgi:hypothetical protein
MEQTTTSTRRRLVRCARAATLGVAVAALLPIGVGALALAPAVADDPAEPVDQDTWTGDVKDHPDYGQVTPEASAAAGDIEAFCQAALAAEAAASTSEDPAVIERAFDAVSAAAPDEVKPAVDTVVASSLAGEEGSPGFDAAYGEVIGYVKDHCGFATVTVTATEYAFAGLPGALAAGPVVVDLDNAGTEFHVLWVVRINDGVTETLDELVALPEDESATKVTDVGGAFAAPGDIGHGIIDLRPGRYIAICPMPTGSTPENMPLVESGEHQGAPHFTHGMVQEFTVS